MKIILLFIFLPAFSMHNTPVLGQPILDEPIDGSSDVFVNFFPLNCKNAAKYEEHKNLAYTEHLVYLRALYNVCTKLSINDSLKLRNYDSDTRFEEIAKFVMPYICREVGLASADLNTDIRNLVDVLYKDDGACSDHACIAYFFLRRLNHSFVTGGKEKEYLKTQLKRLGAEKHPKQTSYLTDFIIILAFACIYLYSTYMPNVFSLLILPLFPGLIWYTYSV